MRRVKREASAFGLSLAGNDENHMGYEKVQSNLLFTELPRNVNICHQVTPKRGTPLLQDPDGSSHPSSPSTGWSGGVLTEGKGGYPGFGDGCINRQRRSEAIPVAQSCDATSGAASQPAGQGGRRGTPRLSSVFALTAAGGPKEGPAGLGAEERGRGARRPRRPSRRGAERRGAARRPQPRFVVIAMHTTNFRRISHFPKIKPEDSCECDRSLQNALAKRSIKVDISLDLFLFYFLIIDSILRFFFSGGEWPAELQPRVR